MAPLPAVPMLRLRRDQAEAIIEHARAEAPNECCGLLLGTVGAVAEVIRGTNVDPDPQIRYQMDPKEVLGAYRRIDAGGPELVGIYHSHVRTEAWPSRTDVARAAYPDALYVIASLRDEASPVLRAYRIEGTRIIEEEVVIQ